MGPLVYTSGNCAECGAYLPPGSLQWGRWFTPAETERPRRHAGSWKGFNGAAGLHQRKPSSRCAPTTSGPRLQWGRWFTPAETEYARLGGTPRGLASMGPLVYTSGNAATHVGQGPGGGLQWGRWFTPAETALEKVFSPGDAAASMGPLVYTSGNLVGSSTSTPPAPGFNGAAGLHQRKPKPPACLRAGRPASMGPLVYTSGNCGISSGTRRWRTRFNGAAGLHQRKR